MKDKYIEIHLVMDTDFVAILPALNWNNHSKSLEFEWLVFGVYINFNK